jgi:hypothetical protein
MKPNDYIVYDCAQLSVEYLTDCAANLVAMHANPIRLLLAAKAAHSALVSALTAVLTQSTFDGALTDKAAKSFSMKPLHEYQTKDPKGDDFLDLRVVTLRDLLEKAKNADLVPKPVEGQDELIANLIYIRDQVEHPKGMGIRSFTADYCVDPIRIAVEIAARLLKDIPNLGDDKCRRATMAAKTIREACDRPANGPLHGA